MTKPSAASVIRHSELLNRLVLDRQTTEKIGYVEQIWLDSLSHRIAGLSCKAGLLSRQQPAFSWEQIDTIGDDAILVTQVSSEASKVKGTTAQSLIGHELWTDTGSKVGKLVDYLFETNRGSIVSYLFIPDGWSSILDGMYILPPIAVSSVGNRRVIALSVALNEAQKYNPKVDSSTETKSGFIQQDYNKTKEDLEYLQQKTQQVASKVLDVTESLGGQAKDKLTQFTSKLKDSMGSEDGKGEESTPENRNLDD